jgi:hypothetical protein
MMTHEQFIHSLHCLLREHSHSEVGLASPRPFSVSWMDEDLGPRSTVVVARSAEDAREIAENATGRYALTVQSL